MDATTQPKRFEMGDVITLVHPKGSRLVGKKIHTDVDDLISIGGLGSKSLSKLLLNGWTTE